MGLQQLFKKPETSNRGLSSLFKKPEQKPFNPNDVRTVSLPEQLGGGQYKTSGAGTLIKTPRKDQIPTKEGYERDHISSVGVGGTSNIENYEYKKSPTNIFGKTIDRKRQEGKMKVEQSAISDYKAGNISLPEARRKIATKQQEIKGLIPKQGVRANLWGGVKEAPKELFKKAKGGLQKLFERDKGAESLTFEATPEVSKELVKGAKAEEVSRKKIAEGQKFQPTIEPVLRAEITDETKEKLLAKAREDINRIQTGREESGEAAGSDLIREIIASVPRGAMSASLEAIKRVTGKRKVITPKTRLGNVLFAGRQVFDSSIVGEEALKSLGVKKPLPKVSLLAGLAINALDVSDVFTGGGKKKIIGNIIKETDPKVIAKLLKPLLKGQSDNVIERLAKSLIDIKNSNDVDRFIKNVSNVEEPLLKEAKKFKTADEFVNSSLNNLNPTGGVFVAHSPKNRIITPLGKNMTTLDKTLGGSPNDIITVYRGTESGKIVPGDFITTNKQLAKDYGGKLTDMKVKKGDILDDITEPLGEDYIYRPNAFKEQIKTKSQLTDIFNKSKETKKLLLPKPKKPIKKKPIRIIPEKKPVDLTKEVRYEPIVTEPKSETVQKVLDVNRKDNFSTHYEKIKNKFGFSDEGIEIERKTNTKTSKKAFDYVQRSPEKSMRIAYGLEDAPLGQSADAIRQSLMVSLDEAGKKTQAELIGRKLSQGFTEHAQALNLAKLDLGDVKTKSTITKQRMERIGSKLTYVKDDYVKVAKNKIKTDSVEAGKEVTNETVKRLKNVKLKEVDKFINSIIC